MNPALAWLSSTSAVGGLIGGICILTALGITAWKIENYRGTRALNLAKARLAEEMTSWDWRDFHQKPAVPPERNQAA
ncbi:MAG: hypothetical protein GWQ05_10780 [Verrucomicrobiaceae bacterium]|nr:hypothetical protein [Verrucomicrobiaceae bacterium]